MAEIEGEDVSSRNITSTIIEYWFNGEEILIPKSSISFKSTPLSDHNILTFEAVFSRPKKHKDICLPNKKKATELSLFTLNNSGSSEQLINMFHYLHNRFQSKIYQKMRHRRAKQNSEYLSLFLDDELSVLIFTLTMHSF